MGSAYKEPRGAENYNAQRSLTKNISSSYQSRVTNLVPPEEKKSPGSSRTKSPTDKAAALMAYRKARGLC